MSASTSRTLRRVGRFVLIALAVIWSVGPLVLMYTASFKTDDVLAKVPPTFVFTPTLEHYRKLLDTTPFVQYLWNTLVVAISTTVLSLTFGALAAYSFTRFRFPGSDSLPLFYLVMRMLPRFVLVIPYYLLMRQIGLLNTHSALILAYAGFSLPFCIWLLIGFFKEIPIELEEAGMVDGANRLGVFTRIVIPLVAPGLAATAIFTFLLGWNELLFSLVLAGRDSRTLPTLATSFSVSDRGIEWGPLNAMGSLVLLPVIVMALLVQQHIVKGMTMGAVKG
ncbi:MAG TPA: carbohydrate ABC transporter permease [Chloroflexota bacterium]|nr:carbohydrate ABC transporter permease [Chloroflexota bacterium]